jgi:hypothetical protein
MRVELKQVTVDEKEILRNLLEKYNYEFSKWDKRDVNKLGLYGYPFLDYYWTEDKRWAYFIFADDNIAGFAMYFIWREDLMTKLLSPRIFKTFLFSFSKLINCIKYIQLL